MLGGCTQREYGNTPLPIANPSASVVPPEETLIETPIPTTFPTPEETPLEIIKDSRYLLNPHPYWDKTTITYAISEDYCMSSSCNLFREKVRKGVIEFEKMFDSVFTLEEAEISKADIVFNLTNGWQGYGLITAGEAQCRFLQERSGRTQYRHCVINYNQLDGCYVPMIIIHELGHAFGLSHIEDVNNIMNPQQENCFAEFNDEQIRLIKEIYNG